MDTLLFIITEILTDLRINLTIEVKNFNCENFKTLNKEIKKDMRKWQLVLKGNF